MNKTLEWKEQITSSPLALGLIGGALGAAIGGSLARSRRASFSGDRWSSTGRFRSDRDSSLERGAYADFGDEGPSEAAGGMREKLAEGAQQLKDKAGNVMAEVRERIPSPSELGRKADDNPMLVALGGLALGAIAALLVPVSRKERELLDPVKQRAGEAIGTLGEKLGDTVQQAQQKIASTSGQSPQQEKFPADEPPLLTH